jgi:Rrf2 family protein
MHNSSRPSHFIRASEAATLGLHAAALLARTDRGLLTAREIAHRLEVSEAHLAKVLSLLERADIVAGTRGPSGGYRLTRPADRISVQEVYEAVEGPLGPARCPFSVPVCDGTQCVLGKFFRGLARDLAEELHRTTIADITIKPGGSHGKTQENH